MDKISQQDAQPEAIASIRVTVEKIISFAKSSPLLTFTVQQRMIALLEEVEQLAQLIRTPQPQEKEAIMNERHPASAQSGVCQFCEQSSKAAKCDHCHTMNWLAVLKTELRRTTSAASKNCIREKETQKAISTEPGRVAAEQFVEDGLRRQAKEMTISIAPQFFFCDLCQAQIERQGRCEICLVTPLCKKCNQRYPVESGYCPRCEKLCQQCGKPSDSTISYCLFCFKNPTLAQCKQCGQRTAEGPSGLCTTCFSQQSDFCLMTTLCVRCRHRYPSQEDVCPRCQQCVCELCRAPIKTAGRCETCEMTPLCKKCNKRYYAANGGCPRCEQPCPQCRKYSEDTITLCPYCNKSKAAVMCSQCRQEKAEGQLGICKSCNSQQKASLLSQGQKGKTGGGTLVQRPGAQERGRRF